MLVRDGPYNEVGLIIASAYRSTISNCGPKLSLIDNFIVNRGPYYGRFRVWSTIHIVDSWSAATAAPTDLRHSLIYPRTSSDAAPEEKHLAGSSSGSGASAVAAASWGNPSMC